MIFYQLFPPHHQPPHQLENPPPHQLLHHQNEDQPLNHPLELYDVCGGTELIAALEMILFI